MRIIRLARAPLIAGLGGLLVGGAVGFWAATLDVWHSSAHLTSADAKGIAAAPLHDRGDVSCDTARFRSNGVWLVTCAVSVVATPTCGVPFYFNGERIDNCSEPVTSRQQYLILVDDGTGKIIDYTP